nr:LacI family DNA-binding transcriptional regulator [uncultured Blautia sp.]
MDKSTKKRVTITQVAKHAGVSVGTVSNYLNGTASVSHDRAQRIQNAIDELDYIPDTLASSLRRKDSTAIHVLTPHLDSAFYTYTISTLMHCAYKAGYTVHISSYEYSADIEKQQLRALESSKPGTSVIVFNGFDDLTEIKRLARKQIHVILADRQKVPGYTSSVVFDNRRAPFEIVRLLKSKNYKRIGLFTEPTELQNIHERGEGFLEAMRYFGFSDPERYIYSRPELSLDKLKNSYLYMMEILNSSTREELPDAWLATSDYLAFGMMRAINEKGYSIPEDIAIVGYDNIEISGYVNPRLTTVEQDQKLFGKTLWSVITEYNKTGKYQNIELPQKIKMRGSC